MEGGLSPLESVKERRDRYPKGQEQPLDLPEPLKDLCGTSTTRHGRLPGRGRHEDEKNELEKKQTLEILCMQASRA